MKKHLIDVPVKINIWIREECFQKQFDVICQARPSILFIQSDGGRNSKENEAILRNRDYVDSRIDWDCRVYRFYESNNNGLYSMGKKVSSFVWETVDKCVFLEDDDIPDVSFFKFCYELLERYKDDCRILGITGYNAFGVSEEIVADYFFSGESNSWGTATWKRANELIRSEDYSYLEDPYVLRLLNQHLGKHLLKRAIICGKNKMIDGHVPGSEFLKGLSRATQNGLFITPKYNLISNYGCGDDAVHSVAYKVMTKEEQKMFFSKTYSYDFPLNHPKYVIRDVFYEKKLRQLLCVGHPFKVIYRKIIKGVKTIYYGGFSSFIEKLKKNKINRVEK